MRHGEKQHCQRRGEELIEAERQVCVEVRRAMEVEEHRYGIFCYCSDDACGREVRPEVGWRKEDRTIEQNTEVIGVQIQYCVKATKLAGCSGIAARNRFHPGSVELQ